MVIVLNWHHNRTHLINGAVRIDGVLAEGDVVEGGLDDH
jgi:hypothetical protein